MVMLQGEVTMEQAAIEAALREVVEHATGATPAASASPVLEHVASLVAPLAAAGSFDDEVWDQVNSQDEVKDTNTIDIRTGREPT